MHGFPFSIYLCHFSILNIFPPSTSVCRGLPPYAVTILPLQNNRRFVRKQSPAKADSFPVRSFRPLTGRTSPVGTMDRIFPRWRRDEGQGAGMVQKATISFPWREGKSGESRGAASHFCKINMAPSRGYVVFCYKNPAKAT